MTRENAKLLLPIIQAFAEGKTVQLSNKGCLDTYWEDLNADESFCFPADRYRIKPEPVIAWIVIGPYGSIVGAFSKHGKEQCEDLVKSSLIQPCRIVKLQEVPQ
jgi:hypothetical protein